MIVSHMDGHGRSSTENDSSVMSFQSFLAATSIIPSVDSSIGGGSNDFAGQDLVSPIISHIRHPLYT